MLRVLIVDDEPLARENLRILLETQRDIEIVGECGNAVEAIGAVHKLRPDVLFLDIQMPRISGLEMVGMLDPEHRPYIVFLTAFDEYAVKAFELGVNNYILKPFDPERVRRVLEKCRKDLERSSPAQPAGRLAISSDRKIVLLDISRIVYVETCGRSCLIHTTEGDHTENQLLGEYEKRLSPQGFFRIHKSYLVNLNYISEMFPWANNSLAVKMQGFEKNILPVSREKVKNLRQLLGL